jgi:hypothetical protein
LDRELAGISIFVFHEDLLLKVLDILEVGEENTFVEPHQLHIWTIFLLFIFLTSFAESYRVCLVLGLSDWCLEIFEEPQTFVFDDVICAFNVDFSVLVGWIGVVDHVLDGPIDDELVSEPWVHFGDELIDTRQSAHLLDLIGFNGVTKIILSVLELTALHVLFNILNRAAVMIIENVHNAILVKEWDLNLPIQFIGVNFAFDGSILAALTLIHGLLQLIEKHHLIWWQRGQWRILILINLVEGDCLEWAHNDDLLTESKLSGSFCIGVLNSGESVLSPVLTSTDINPFFIGLSSLILDLGEVPQVSDVESPCLIIIFLVVSVHHDNIEVPRSPFLELVSGDVRDRGREVPAMDELDDIGGNLFWQHDLGAGKSDLFLRNEIPSLE